MAKHGSQGGTEVASRRQKHPHPFGERKRRYRDAWWAKLLLSPRIGAPPPRWRGWGSQRGLGGWGVGGAGLPHPPQGLLEGGPQQGQLCDCCLGILSDAGLGPPALLAQGVLHIRVASQLEQSHPQGVGCLQESRVWGSALGWAKSLRPDHPPGWRSALGMGLSLSTLGRTDPRDLTPQDLKPASSPALASPRESPSKFREDPGLLLYPLEGLPLTLLGGSICSGARVHVPEGGCSSAPGLWHVGTHAVISPGHRGAGQP